MTPEHGPHSALWVLSELEAQAPDATGALVYGPQSRILGVVLAERGRVCWAAAQGLRQRLTDLLRMCCVPAMDAEGMDRLFQDCRRRRRPVGEALVEMGLVTSRALRSALLHHTAESLCISSSWTGPARFVSHRARGYQSDYTFEATELVAYASALARGRELVDTLSAALAHLTGTRSAAIFEESGEALLACQLPLGLVPGLRALRAAGVWAAESLRLQAGSGSVNQSLKLAPDRRGGTSIAWRDGGFLYTVHCVDREGFSGMLRILQLRGWTSAVQSTIPLGEHALAAAG